MLCVTSISCLKQLKNFPEKYAVYSCMYTELLLQEHLLITLTKKVKNHNSLML